MSRYHNTLARTMLLEAGQGLRKIPLQDGTEGELDNCSVHIKAVGPRTYSFAREATAALRPEALLGFGALLGIDKQLALIFPNGADLNLHVKTEGWPDTHVTIGRHDNPSLAIHGMAHAYPDPLLGGIWIEDEESPVLPQDQELAFAAIQKPEVLLAAAEFTLRLAERLSSGASN